MISRILPDMPILLEDLNLHNAERMLCEQALRKAGSIVEAAQLLGITRHALKRRMIKHRIDWPGLHAHDTRMSTVVEPSHSMV
jgi:DNA-binding NtrC family response regulator